MNAPNILCAAAAACTLFVAAGCGSSGAAGEHDVGPSNSSTEELEAIYRARIESARTHFTDADVFFMTGMIAHHAQALVMAAMAPTHGASPEIRTLAARIENAQKDEIASMQRWLADRGQPVPEFHIEGTQLTVLADGKPVEHDHDSQKMHDQSDRTDEHHDHMGHHGDEDHGLMPGMLTQEQLEELDAARGDEFDRLFLEFMIHHHGGAVTMVDDLFSTDGAGQDEAAFRLASDIQVDQITEIERMKLMLDARSQPSKDR